MSRDLIELIRDVYPTLSKGQKKISDYILDHYDKAAYMTAYRLGSEVGVSESTVVRYAIELGFEGYPEFNSCLRETLGMRLTAVQRMEVSDDRISEEKILDSVLTSDAERIRKTLDNIDRAAFDRAIGALLSARRIYVIGMRSSSPLADFLSYYLSLVFDDVRRVRTTSGSEVFEQLMRIDERDVMIAVSFPRYSTRIVSAVDYAVGTGAKVISITDSNLSPIANGSFATLTAKSDMVSFGDSLVAPLSIINAIIVAIGKKKKSEIGDTFSRLEAVWEEYNVYNKGSGDRSPSKE